MTRWLTCLLLLVGCNGDVCRGVSGGCIALEVQSNFSLDQLVVNAPLAGLSRVPSPKVPRAQPARPPVKVAVLVGDYIGALNFQIEGWERASLVGVGNVGVTLELHQHVSQTVLLGGSSNPTPDLAAAPDLAGVTDHSSPPDLGHADLATTSFDLAQTVGPTWQKETYQGPFLEALFARSRSDVWAGGENGTLVHSTGNGDWSFQSVSLGSLNRVHSIIGVGNDLWVTGENAIAHATGAGGLWTNELSNDYELFGAFAVPGGFLFAGGICVKSTCTTADSGILRSTGNGSWAPISSPDTRQVLDVFWASGPNDLYIAGSGGFIYHSVDGATLSPQSLPISDQIFTMWGSGPTDIYAASFNDLLHSTGNGVWVVQQTGFSPHMYEMVSGSSATDVYLAGTTDNTTATQKLLLHSTGNGVWTSEVTPPASQFTAVLSFGPDDAYAVGADSSTPIILHKK